MQHFREEKGSALVLVALTIVVLFGFAALAIDGGYLYYRHTRLQDVADATALASAIELSKNPPKNLNATKEEQKKKAAFEAAVKYVGLNGISVSNTSNYTADISLNSSNEQGKMIVSFPESLSKAKVDIELNTNLYFARVLGKDLTLVPVTAVAQVGSASKQTGGLIPVAIVDDPDDPTDGNYVQWRQYEMTLGPGGGANGNFGWLDFGAYEGVGGNTLSYYLEHGYPGTLEAEETIETKTGVSVGLAADAIDNRLSLCNASTYDLETYIPEGDTFTNYYEARVKEHLEQHEDCSRLVYTPIVNSIGENGSSTVTIVGFAAFFLDSYVHNGDEITLVGAFIDVLNPEDIMPNMLDYTVQSVMLIE
ncbi:pilus assembly protein TadG-related protein [Metallumcola ferriviriculae]|uniref:Pilus assembly protein TadG-related protein n=1 Tax=Metallumcola ferriviriculae TaxID=3039180 RepID=A0AAU0UNF4_9FIRM|nr:pilus assembly protein TadG-related protein [Desulfitibacteraceae bacterium MK1]